jgi:hypothetical protein
MRGAPQTANQPLLRRLCDLQGRPTRVRVSLDFIFGLYLQRTAELPQPLTHARQADTASLFEFVQRYALPVVLNFKQEGVLPHADGWRQRYRRNDG